MCKNALVRAPGGSVTDRSRREGGGTGYARAMVRLLLATTAVSLLLGPATATSVDSPTAMMWAGSGYYGEYLVKPKKFDWDGGGGTGEARSVRWQGWGSRRAVGSGRAKSCSNRAGVGCVRNRPVKIIASERRSFLGPEGETQYVYCRLILRGRLGANGSGETISITGARPPAVPCRR